MTYVGGHTNILQPSNNCVHCVVSQARQQFPQHAQLLSSGILDERVYRLVSSHFMMHFLKLLLSQIWRLRFETQYTKNFTC